MCRKHGLAGPAIWWKPTPVARCHPSIRNSEPIEIGTLLLRPEPLPDLKPSERFPSRGSRTRRRRAGRPGARGAGAFAEAGSAGSSVPGAGRGVPTCCRVGAAPSPSRAVGPPSIDVARRPRRAPAPRNEARSNAQTTHESVACAYSWEWIGLNPNPNEFWPMNSIGFGSNWIWISIALDPLGLDSIG